MATKTDPTLADVIKELQALRAEVRALTAEQSLSAAQKYQVEALTGMLGETSDDRVTAWVEATIARIREGAEYGRGTKTFEVVGSRKSTPSERIARLTGQANTEEVPF